MQYPIMNPSEIGVEGMNVWLNGLAMAGCRCMVRSPTALEVAGLQCKPQLLAVTHAWQGSETTHAGPQALWLSPLPSTQRMATHAPAEG